MEARQLDLLAPESQRVGLSKFDSPSMADLAVIGR